MTIWASASFAPGLFDPGGCFVEAPLYDGKTDYDQLVKDIFEAQKVICWW